MGKRLVLKKAVLSLLFTFILIFSACTVQMPQGYQSSSGDENETLTETEEKSAALEETTESSESAEPTDDETALQNESEAEVFLVPDTLPEVAEDYQFTGSYDIACNGKLYLLVGVMDDDMPHPFIDWRLIQPDNLKARKDFVVKAPVIFGFDDELYTWEGFPDIPYIYDLVLSLDMSKYMMDHEIFNSETGSKMKSINHSVKAISHDLSKCVVEIEIGDWKNRIYEYYLLDLENEQITDIGLRPSRNFLYNVLFSPDDSKFCFKMSSSPYRYIYDINRKTYIKKFTIEQPCEYIRQWTSNDELLLVYYNSAYLYDLKTGQTKFLGDDIKEPVISPDGRYLAYYSGKDDNHDGCTGDCVGYYGYDITQNIKDLVENKVYEFPPLYTEWNDTYLLQIPLQWVYDTKGLIQEDDYIDDYETSNYKEIQFVQSFLHHGDYQASNIIDNDPSTCWAEDHRYSACEYGEDGIGESVVIKTYRITDKGFYYDVEKYVKGIRIINGYAKNEQTYYNNNRVKQVEIELSNGNSFVFDLKDGEMGFQTLYFPEPQLTTKVKLYIRDVYRGKKFRDTCISEVEILIEDEKESVQ